MGYEQGLSGLDTASTQLNVIGNNIANSSTVGFKEGSAEFASVYSSTLAQSSSQQVGIGSSVSTVANDFSQGDITTTDSSLDVAINGGGFFQLSNGGTTEYTRNGQFTINADGFVVNASGANLQGYPLNSTGVVTSTTPQSLVIPTTNIPPKSTTTMALQFNLDSQDTVPTNTTFSPTNPNSYTNESGTTIYDSLGNPVQLQTYFVKDSTPGVWSVYQTSGGTLLPSQGTLEATAGTSSTYQGNAGATFPTNSLTTSTLLINGTSVTVTPATPPGILNSDVVSAINAVTFTPPVTASLDNAGAGPDIVLTQGVEDYPAVTTPITVTGSNAASFFGASPTSVTGTSSVAAATAAPAGLLGTLTFNTAGTLTSFANTDGVVGTTPGEISVSIPGGTGGSATPIDTPTLITLNLTGTTQYGIAFNPNNQTQDGYTSGALSGYSISSAGVIQGEYSNGQSQPLAQIVLTTFNDPNGLTSVGNNAYEQTSASGQPIVGTPGGTNLGVLQSGAVESSNVDLTTQLVDLITAQRNYQANAQTIKTQQTVDQALFNL